MGKDNTDPKSKTQANHPVLVTAARWRFGMNVKGLVGAAARDGGR